jgi:hypothetical protein
LGEILTIILFGLPFGMFFDLTGSILIEGFRDTFRQVTLQGCGMAGNGNEQGYVAPVMDITIAPDGMMVQFVNLLGLYHA